MSDKPPVVEAVLGTLIYEDQVSDRFADTLYAYPNGFGSPWSEGEEVNIHVGSDFPRYPTNSVCEIELDDSIRPGYIITRARQVDTSNPEDGFYGEWYEY